MGKPCRKCGAVNVETNAYCRECGAVLSVSTSIVGSQGRPVEPGPTGFRWRWVGLSALAMLGTTAVALAGFVAVAVLALDLGEAMGSLGSMGQRFPALAAGFGLSFLAAFFVGGLAAARVSRGRTVAEPVVGALVVLTVLGLAGLGASEDAPILAGVLALPCAAAAGVGGWIGEMGQREVEL